MTDIILASTSIYRKRQLERVHLNFRAMAPLSQEGCEIETDPTEIIQLRARAKALSLAGIYPEAIIIGSDQGLVFQNYLLGKPGNFDNACAQLAMLSGETANLITSVAVVCKDKNFKKTHTDIQRLKFRKLSQEMIQRYIQIDEPFDCAGSFKIESAGPLLFESLSGEDPTAIEGLPLMALLRILSQLNIDVLA